jgi:hypothetical protein
MTRRAPRTANHHYDEGLWTRFLAKLGDCTIKEAAEFVGINQSVYSHISSLGAVPARYAPQFIKAIQALEYAHVEAARSNRAQQGQRGCTPHRDSPDSPERGCVGRL